MPELAPNLWQLRGSPRHAINVYLAGDVLFDAATRWSARRILRQLGDRRLSLLALTHVHPDHQGAAAAIWLVLRLDDDGWVAEYRIVRD